MKRTAFWRRIASFGIAAMIVLAIVAAYFGPQTIKLIKAYDEILKAIGFFIAPVLAVIGFMFGRIDKAELADKSEELSDKREELGRAKNAAEVAKADAEKARKTVEEKELRIASLEHDLTTIADSSRIWKLRNNEPFPEYRGWRFDPLGAKVVTIGLFKGGVGKTHLAANLAAYVSERQRKPVLLIDLDYQGSLTAMMTIAAGIEPSISLVDHLFADDADLVTLSKSRLHLARHNESTKLNDGAGLSRAWIVPADYSLAEVESRLLVSRVMKGASKIDERYRLAHLLLNPHVRREFGMIILDTPPRMTLGTVNALVASHFYIIPTQFHRVASEAVRPFLEQVKTLSSDLDLSLEVAGVVGTMTRQRDLSENEKKFRDQITDHIREVLGDRYADRDIRHIPHRSGIANSDDLGYFLPDSGGGTLAENFYNPIFDELWSRMHSSAPESG